MLLLPAYKHKLEKEEPVQRVIQCWSVDILRDCFETVDWSVFRDSAAHLNEYATAMTDIITKCMEEGVPTKTFGVFHG